MTSGQLAGAGDFGEAAGFDRSRLLLALSERDRLERVVLLLAGTPAQPSVGEVAETLARAACELVNARAASVTLPELLRQPVWAGPDAGWIGTGFDPIAPEIFAPVLAGEAVHLADTGHLSFEQRAELATADGRQLRSLLALPVGAGGAVHGVLVLAHHRSAAFSTRQVALAQALARHLSGAVEMCGVAEEQRRIAHALQESLLPPLLPAIDGVELAARYRPSGAGNLVGGDFYDLFFDTEGGFYVLLGDSSGIGPEAAGLAGIARYTARALAGPAPPPAEVLAEINVALLRAASDDRFCTAVLAHLRRGPAEAGSVAAGAVEVSLASSGHPPGYVLRSGGALEPASASTGMLLGVTEPAPAAASLLRLARGDALVLYTDGVIEARDEAGETFDDAGVRAVLAAAAGRSAEGIARRLERAALDHRAGGDSDDMAIVVVRIRPEGG